MITKISFTRIEGESYVRIPNGQKKALGEKELVTAISETQEIANFHSNATLLISHFIAVETFAPITLELAIEAFKTYFKTEPQVNKRTKTYFVLNHRWLYVHLTF